MSPLKSETREVIASVTGSMEKYFLMKGYLYFNFSTALSEIQIRSKNYQSGSQMMGTKI